VFGIVIIVWLILATSSIVVENFESFTQTTGYMFQPLGCEYAVRLPVKPKLYSNDIENTTGKLVPLQGAQLTVENGNAFLRAECGSFPGLTRPNKEQMNSYMKIISTRTGLQLPVFEYLVEPSGIIGTVTGTKVSERGSLTIRVINYIGDVSSMTLYVGSKSTDFMMPEMRHFIHSIKKTASKPKVSNSIK